MFVIVLLGIVIVIGALAGVWRARERGPQAVRQSLMVFGAAVLAIGLAWYVLQGRS